MNYNERAYKIIVGYTDKKKVVRTIVAKSDEDFEKLLAVKARYESEPDVDYVTLVRTRKPKSFSYKPMEPVMVDDSGIVSTPQEKTLLFDSSTKQQSASVTRTDAEKVEWARNNKFPARTCLWM